MPAQEIRRSQGRAYPGEPGMELYVLADVHGPFKRRPCPGEVTLTEGERPASPRGEHEAGGVRKLLGNPEPFFPTGLTLNESPHLSVTHSAIGTGLHRGRHDLAKMLVAPCSLQGGDRLLKAVYRPRIVTLRLIGSAEAVVGLCGQDDIPACHSQGQDPLGSDDAVIICASLGEIDRQEERDLCEPSCIVKGFSEGFSLTEIDQDARKVARRCKRRAQGESKVDSQLARLTLRWQMRKGTERLFEGSHSLAVGRAR